LGSLVFVFGVAAPPRKRTMRVAVDSAGVLTSPAGNVQVEDKISGEISINRTGVECELKNTPYNTGGSGDGEVYNLDEHDLNCGTGKVMTSWTLKRVIPSSDVFRMEYECCTIPGGATSQSGSQVVEGGTEIKAMTGIVDMKAIDCDKQNGFVQQWVVRRRKPRKKFGEISGRRRTIAIQYKCALPASGYTRQCQSIKGQAADDGKGEGGLFYLDRQNPSCPDGNFMSSWDIKRTDDASTAWIRTDIKCCSVEYQRIAECQCIARLPGLRDANASHAFPACAGIHSYLNSSNQTIVKPKEFSCSEPRLTVCSLLCLNSCGITSNCIGNAILLMPPSSVLSCLAAGL